MPQSLAFFDAALKDDYGPGLRNALNNSNVVFTEVGRNTEDIVGRRAVWAAHTGRSTSTGARAELGTLPTADRQRFTQLTDDLAYLYQTIKVSGQALHLTRGDEGAFTRALEAELKGAKDDIMNDVNRQCFGSAPTINSAARTGTLGQITGVASNTFTMANMSDAEMRYFFINEKVDVINGTTAANRGTATITAISRANKTITVDAAPSGSATNDYVARQGSFDAEMNGLRHLINATSVYAGVDPSTVPSWASQAVGSTTTPISEVLLDQAAEAVETDGNGTTPRLYIFEHLQRRKLASTLQTQKRYDGRQMTLEAGWEGLNIARGTLVVDRFCPTNDGFAINTGEIERFVGLDFTWDTDDKGGVLYKALDNSDAVEARYKSYQNLEVTTRNAHTRITVSTPSFT